MSSRVVFTGAGASRSFGLPLTGDLLGLILDGIKNASLFRGHNKRAWQAASREQLERYLGRLLPGLKEIEDPSKLPMVTEVFSMVDYALNSGELLPIGTISEHREFRHLLILAIADIIMSDWEENWDATVTTESRHMEVCDALCKYLQAVNKGPINLITTNYDITIDSRLYERMSRKTIEGQLDLGFDWRSVGGNVRTRPQDPTLRILKLHGSFDTLHCPYCGHVYFNEHGSIAWQAFRTELDDLNTCECSERDALGIHIVSMSLVRDIRDANLLSVWRSALETLRTASEWVIIGYSMPQEDLAIRSLLMRAYHGANVKPKITIVQQGNKAEASYKALFPHATYVGNGLEEFLIAQGFLTKQANQTSAAKAIKKAR